jgi:hypothetical protein
MYSSCPGETSSALKSFFRDEKFISGSKLGFFATDYHRVLSLDADYILVKFMAVRFRSSICVARPVGDLAAVLAREVVAFDVLCMLALGWYTVFGVFHERWEIIHLVKPSEGFCGFYPKSFLL